MSLLTRINLCYDDNMINVQHNMNIVRQHTVTHHRKVAQMVTRKVNLGARIAYIAVNMNNYYPLEQ